MHERIAVAAQRFLEAISGRPDQLVASGPVPGQMVVHDDVVAMSWDKWVPAEMVDALVEGASL